MKPLLIITAIVLSILSLSDVTADPAEREGQKKICMEHLAAIGKAIDAYRAGHNNQLPDWMSELYPKYLQDSKLLLCPADETGGVPDAPFTAYKDPKMPCSYHYQFNPMKFSGALSLFDMNAPQSYTYREGKTLQLKYFGHRVLVVRCHHHGSPMLNLDYDGKLYFSPISWEYTPESAKAVLSFFQRAIVDNPDGWEKELSLRALYDYFRGTNRLPDFRTLLEKQPTLSTDALKILGEVYQSEGQMNQAIEIYERALKRVPEDVETRLGLAKLYATEKNYKAARTAVGQVLKLEPHNLTARRLQAELEAISDADGIQKRFAQVGDQDEAVDRHYLIKLEERLLASEKTLLPTVRKVREILNESFGESEAVTRLSHLYQSLEKSLASHSGAWKKYTTSDGLIGDYVSAIAQDKRGILWIATQNGVCQYDGESFTPATFNDAFRGTYVLSLFIDKAEHLWFGTTSKGVFRWDGQNVVNYTVKDGLAGNAVTAITQDRNGSLWFACAGSGISRYDGKTFTNFTTADGLADNLVNTIMEDGRGGLWIGTGSGASRYDGKTFRTLTAADGLAGNDVHAIIEDRKGVLWFGTNNGVSRKAGEKWTSFTKKEGLIANSVSDMLEDHEGNLWFTSPSWDGGVSRYDGKTFTHFTMADGLAGNYINTVFEDREGNLWFGHSNANGLSKFNLRVLKNYGVQEDLSETDVTSIAEDLQGNLWIAANGSVVKYDGTTFTQPIAESRRVLGNVFMILSDSKHNLWFATQGRGLIRYDGTNYTRFTTLNGLVGNCIVSDVTNPIIADKNGNLWVGARGSGLSRYDGNHFTNWTMADGLPSDSIVALTEDSHGNIWMGTWGDGVIRYAPPHSPAPPSPPTLGGIEGGKGGSEGGFTQADGLVENLVGSMLTDRQGRLWIGTLGGLSQYDFDTASGFDTAKPTQPPATQSKDGKSFVTLPQFVGKLITTMIEDRKGYLWVGTLNSGVIKCATDGNTFTQLTTADGLPSNRVWALHEDRAGNIWIGTHGGLTKYTPSPTPPSIYIESIVADQVYTHPKEVTLSAGTKHFRVNYKAVSFVTRPEAMQYLYRLEGHERTAGSLPADNGWQGPTHERSAEYLNLKPGSYTFKVKAVNRDLVYSEPASVTVKVVPPFYASAGFLVPTVGGGTILTVLLVIQAVVLVKRRRQVLAYQRVAVAEVREARQMQMSLLPKSAPQIEGFDIAGACEPATDVGGDYFTYLWLDEAPPPALLPPRPRGGPGWGGTRGHRP